MMKKLLLADDSITIQKVVGIIFSTEEYQLEMTDNGDNAFNKALEEFPDLVIADISMPGKDGFELCRAIKNEPSLSNTSVLLLPGAFDHFDESKAGEVCADGWLTKPFESQALLDKVSQLLAAEPVRMAGVAAADREDSPVEGQDKSSEGDEDQSVDEAVLGFEEVDALETPTDEIEEESPDDIWDAVSFAEEDLQNQSESVSIDATDAASFAADVIDPSAVDDVAVEPATDEQVLSAFTAETENEFVEEAADADELQPEPFETVDLTEEETVPELSDQVESVSDIVGQASTEEAESVDFSAFSEAKDDFQQPAADVTEESAYFVPDAEDDEPLELLDELEEGSVEIAEESDYLVAATEEDSPLELMEGDLAEQSAEVDLTEEEPGSFVAEADDEEAIMELQEEEELVELEPVMEEPTATEASDVPFGEAADDDSFAVDDILDLSEDDVVAFEPLDESIEETAVADEVEPLVVEAPEDKFEFVDEAEEEAELVEEKAELVEEELELVEEEVDLVEEEADLVEEETELAEDLEPLSTVAEDDDFYFDATAEDDKDVAAVTAGAVGLAAGVAAVSFGDTEDEESATAQVEQQLRELSEDELREVVTKVAGPMIEKLASEMLEKVAWEVVPDLAEAMINEEIRKIKEGA
ncbi:MAG: response regulator [Desulfuromusa sp.]|nr:response regulator [Desulfuromusa sp.]